MRGRNAVLTDDGLAALAVALERVAITPRPYERALLAVRAAQ
ncbi:hypothetical protein OG568_02155 [Streptomyces sp. NBC_01450]|nr:hypothetical protein [Streptomyces sp. NBC_01450]